MSDEESSNQLDFGESDEESSEFDDYEFNSDDEDDEHVQEEDNEAKEEEQLSYKPDSYRIPASRLKFFSRGDYRMRLHMRGAYDDIQEDEFLYRDGLQLREQICPRLKASHWQTLGDALTDNVEIFNVSNCSLNHRKLEALLQGLSPLFYLQELYLGKNDIGGEEGVEMLAEFYLNKKGDSLGILALNDINLFGGSGEFDFLGVALEWSTLERLDLSNNPVGPYTDWKRLSAFFRCFAGPDLWMLNLKGCKIGREGIFALGTTLQNKEVNLAELYLEDNALDDDCIGILTEALKNNKTLEKLSLENNENITANGIDTLCRLLLNESSIQETYDSNHVIERILCSSELSVSSSYRKLSRLLSMNWKNVSKEEIARKKVADTHFHCQQRLRQVLDLDVKLMPYVFSWFKDLDQPATIFKKRGTSHSFGMRAIPKRPEEKRRENLEKLSIVYRIVRGSNVAVLFGFPSAERLRMGDTISKLEEKNAELETKLKALMSSLDEERNEFKAKIIGLEKEKNELKSEMERLVAENEMLKSKKCSTVDDDGSLGRKRFKE